MLISWVFPSLLLGSAFAKIVAKFIVYGLNINLYSKGLTENIPTVSPELALAKSFDLLDFGFAIFMTFLFFAFFAYFFKAKNRLIFIAHLLFSLLIFFQVHFANYNPLHTLIFTLLFFVATLFFQRFNSTSKTIRFDPLLIANGTLTGFYLLLLVNNLTTTILPFAFLLLTPLAYLLCPEKLEKYLKSHFHLFFALAVFFPTTRIYLVILGTVVSFLITLLNRNFTKKYIYKIIYPTTFIFLLAFNPLYYIGPFDSVEEGFWLGWLSSMLQGGLLYKDIALYHPPFLLWFMFAIQKGVGFSIANSRLILHLLQIVGIMIYFFTANSILKTRISKIVVLFLALGLTSTMVRNNIEIRLGMGLASILALAYCHHAKQKWLVFAGLFAGFSLLTSVEVGVAVLISGFVSVLLFSTSKLKALGYYFVGLLSVLVPIALWFLAQGQLVHLIEQVAFYITAFSNGYFNIAVERPATLAFIHVHIINQFVSSKAVMWEIARWGISAGLITVFVKLKTKDIDTVDKTALSLAIFGIVLFRSALGRSDYYHLLFPLLVSLPLVFYVAETLSTMYKSKFTLFALAFVCIFIFSRDMVFASFGETFIYRLQTYGREIDTSEPILSNEKTKLLEFINTNTGKEDSIFVYPWAPELYFLTERKNATRFDTPYAFYSDKYQTEMVASLQLNKPKFVIYNPEMKFGNLTPDSLPLVNKYILENFREVENFGGNKVLVSK